MLCIWACWTAVLFNGLLCSWDVSELTAAQEKNRPPLVVPKNMKRLTESELLKRVKKQVEPELSTEKLALDFSRTGRRLVVEVTVNEQGDVVEARAISGVSLLKDAAVEAAKGRKFAPFKEKGISYVVGAVTMKDPIQQVDRELLYSIKENRSRVEREPQSWLAHCALGRAYLDHRYHEDAIRAYQKAVELSPRSAVAHFGLADSYSRLKRLEQALNEYQQAAHLKPDFVEAYYGIGWMYRDLAGLDRDTTEEGNLRF
jgi:tetratricopeptide (TPR) repeat protein